jgi:sulfur carrier protein ThiS
MQVSVKLFGALRQYLPPGSGFNSCELTLDENPMLQDVLDRITIPQHRAYLVIINDKKINREDYATKRILENDEIVLLPPIKGG